MKPLILKSVIAASILLGSLQPASATSDYCREYNSRVRVGDAPAAAYGTACYQPDGSWEIVGNNNDFQQETIQTAYYQPQPTYVNNVRYVTTRDYVSFPNLYLSFGDRPIYRHYYHNDRRYYGRPGWDHGRGHDDHRGHRDDHRDHGARGFAKHR
jgi:hypothetical protein